MKKGLKVFGRSLVSLSPAAIAIGMNFIISIIMGVICGVILGMELKASGGMNTITDVEMMNRLMDMIMEYALPATVVFQLINLVIFGLWFKLWGRNKFVNPVKVVKASHVGVAFMSAVALEIIINFAMMLVSMFAPEVIEAFNELMETSGVAEMTVLSFLATVILAPITEELIFRGVTMKLTKWAGLPFVIGNIIQAVLFGVFHLNLVQGVYATFIGLVLGYLGYRYKTLWVPILLHLFCNLYATVIGMFEIPDTMMTNVVMAVIAVVCIAGTIFLMKKENEKAAAQDSIAVAENN